MPFLDEDGVTRLTEDYLDIFALKNHLDATKLVGIISSGNLPSYVDDVLEYNGVSNFPATGETGKIYVDTSDNNTYRWTGTAYVSISNPLDYATQAEAETGADNTKVMTPLRTAQELAAKTDSALSSSSTNPVRNNVIKQALDQKLDIDDYHKAMTWGEVGDKYEWGVLGSTSQTAGTTYTDVLGLEKPGNNSTVDISTINDNYDIIDEAVEETQSSIAMIESHTAQSNHAIGSYFMLDNVLHKATSAIASGETITPGGNATPITLEQALSALNSSVSNIQDSLVSSISRSGTSFTAKNSKGTSLFTFDQKDDNTTYGPSSISTTSGTWTVLSFGKLHLCWLTRARVTIACTQAWGSGYYGTISEPVYPKSGAMLYFYATPASANFTAIGTGVGYVYCPVNKTESVDVRYFVVILSS